MSTLSYAITDSATMLRRDLRHTVRYPTTMIMALGMPVILLLLFTGVFGEALNAGLAGAPHSGAYIDYVVPGILLMTVGYGSSTTALAVNADMTEGIIARFRTMSISRASVLTGHVAGAMIRTLVSIGLVIGVALLMGFRPAADPAGWIEMTGVVALLVFALTWMAVAVGLAAKNPQGANGFILVVQVLPFLSSAFVPPESMSGAVRWFAQHEPFTPIIDTVRGLLMGAQAGSSAIIAVAWCAGIALAGYLWALALFNRDPIR